MKVDTSYSACFFSVLFFLNVFVTPPGVQQAGDYYDRGKAELQKGAWKEALNIWLKAKTEIGELHGADPRIGFAFMDVVTRHKASEYYQVADQMYFWGISGAAAEVARYHAPLQEELDRLKPIMNQKEGRHLQQLLNQSSPDFMAELTEFWIKRDPFPASEYNERLLEHWERIQQARRKFTLRTNSVYQTDDRGLIYVRFGPPAEIKRRAISVNKIVDPVSGASIPLQNNISVKAEIWYYHHLRESEPYTSFVFGHPGDGGPFGLQPGILSLVPVSGNRVSSYYDDQKVLARQMSQSSYGGSASGTKYDDSGGGMFVLPGYTQVSRKGAELMLKYAVLEEIGAIDPFYNELHNSMARDIIKAGLSNREEKFTQTARASLASYDNREVTSSLRRDRALPAHTSTTKSPVEHLTVNRQILRFMNPEFQTIYMLTSEAVDYQPLMLYASTHAEGLSKKDLVQLNTLYEYNKQWHLLRQQPHLIPINDNGRFGKGVYYFEADVANKPILFCSQYLDRSPDGNEQRRHDKLNAHIIASTGAEELQFPDPLRLQGADQVQMSDILLADIQQENRQQRIPFVPNLNNTFESGESMLVYFEVYNLPAGTDFQIEYKIEGLDRKQRTKKIGRSIILNYASEGGVSPNWFEVPLSDLPNYRQYRLELTLRLPDTAEKIQRSDVFKMKAAN